MPKGEDDQLKVRQIQVLVDGACDAMGLVFFETSRGELKSTEWEGRQLRKVYGVLKACDEFVKTSSGKFLVKDEFSVADVRVSFSQWLSDRRDNEILTTKFQIAISAMLNIMNMIQTKFGLIQWTEQYPGLKKYWEMLEERESFKETQSYMFELTEKVA